MRASLTGPVAQARTKRLSRSCTRQPHRSPSSGCSAALFFSAQTPTTRRNRPGSGADREKHLGDGRGVTGCPLEPPTDRLVLLPRDLFGRSQTASAHHDQQRLSDLRGIRLQAIHRRALGFPKVGLTAAAAVALPASMSPIAHDMRDCAVRIGTRRQTCFLFAPYFLHRFPPPLSCITPF